MTTPHHETCWTHLRLASNGDSTAREAFAATYEATIRSFLAMRWRGRSLARAIEDATQDVFIECFKTGGVLARADETAGDFRGLLFGVVRNVARRFEDRQMGSRQLEPEESQWLAGLAHDEPGQATMFDREWARALVRKAQALHEERAAQEGAEGQRRIELLRRRFGDDQQIRQIAASWGVPAQDVHNAYRKARNDFYACLREVVGFHTSGDVERECKQLLGLLTE